MSSAAMASSSVSQEDVENDFERTSRRSRIRMARGRDVRGHQPAAACRIVGEPVVETEDGPEPRALDASGYSGDHDASPKPTTRAKEKRPIRPSHINKGKQQRDRRKLREKRRSTGVVHLPSTEVSSTGGSTNEDDEEQAGQGMCAETRRNTQQNEFMDPAVAAGAADPVARPFQKSVRNKSLSDLDADDEDNQEADHAGDGGVSAVSTLQKQRHNGQSAATAHQLEEENRRLMCALHERDQRIAVLEAALLRYRAEKQHLRQENDALVRAMESLGTQ